MNLDYISLAISILALALTTFFKFQQYHINERLERKYKREEENAKKAILDVCFSQDAHGDFRFSIRNKGESPARNVRLFSSDIGFISKAEEADQGEFTLYILNGDRTINFLDSGDHIEYYAIVYTGNMEHPRVNLLWEDDFCQSRTVIRTANALFSGSGSTSLY